MTFIDNTGKNLSIVIQGGFFEKNAVEVAHITFEYRKIFPNSEIILSISSSDFLDPSKKKLFPYSKIIKNRAILSACNILNTLVDKFVFCGDILPLPPVNIKHPNCNANYQIEAAKQGLKNATKEFVLRVRNDFLFKDNSFLEQYVEMCRNTRGSFSVFEERIMICSLFTLNPYALERLPFHYSDWFHFGKLSDVRLLWEELPHISLNYMTHYVNNSYLPGSNELERHFLAKTAIEQYISFSFFSKKFSELQLSCHNDIYSRRESIDILLDNFCIFDDKKSPIYFPKYMKDFLFRPNEKICISHTNWNFLVKNRNTDPEKLLTYNKGQIYKNNICYFPFILNASDMKTKIGKYLGKDIVITKTDCGGVALFGPHYDLTGGMYCARIHMSSFVSKETLMKIRATLEHGEILLNEEEFLFKDYCNNFLKHKNFLEIDFHFICPDKVGKDFEIVLEIDRVEDMAISYVEIFNTENRPKIEEMPLAFRYYMGISSRFMKKSLLEKRDKNPYAFFKDSKSIFAKYPKKIYLDKWEKMNKKRY